MSEALTFEQDIKPMFREKDRNAMMFAFDLWDESTVRQNANDILERIEAGDMPCDGPWSAEQIEAFKSWVAAAPA
jgi:hypothetical protein